MQRIGLLGGTFDPVHHGHLVMASEVLHALELDRVLFVPAGIPPHKPDQIISTDQDRLAMLDLAIENRPGFGICRIDIEREGPSYSSDMLRLYREMNPDVHPYFILGADSLVDLPNWHQPSLVPRLAELVVACRPGHEFDLPQLELTIPALRNRVTFVAVPQLEISSRSLRTRVRLSQPIWYLLPRNVEAYIASKSLYLQPENEKPAQTKSSRLT